MLDSTDRADLLASVGVHVDPCSNISPDRVAGGSQASCWNRLNHSYEPESRGRTS